jgi:hypothetical protein
MSITTKAPAGAFALSGHRQSKFMLKDRPAIAEIQTMTS